MEEFLRVLTNYEVGAYIIFGSVILINFRRILGAIQMLRKSTFGLEKEVAQKKLRSSVTISVLVFLLGISYFWTLEPHGISPFALELDNRIWRVIFL